MAVKNIITHGFGPAATIPLVITDGYSIGLVYEEVTGNSKITTAVTGESKITTAVTGVSNLL